MTGCRALIQLITPCMPQLHHVSFAYPHRVLWQQYSVDLRASRLCLQAPNGYGKSTLLLLIAGLLEQAQGDILLQGQRCDASSRTAQVALASDSIPYPDWLTAQQLLDLQQACWQKTLDPALLSLLDFHDQLQTPYGHLSSGNRKKCQLLLALLRQCPLLLLDEPGAGLDQRSLQQLPALLAAYPGQVILTSHEPALFQHAGFVLQPLTGRQW